jgi:hypothetical protein
MRRLPAISGRAPVRRLNGGTELTQPYTKPDDKNQPGPFEIDLFPAVRYNPGFSSMPEIRILVGSSQKLALAPDLHPRIRSKDHWKSRAERRFRHGENVCIRRMTCAALCSRG